MASGNVSIGSAVYVSDGLTGKVAWTWQLILNASDGDVIKVFANVKDQSGKTLGNDLKEFPVSSQTKDLNGNFVIRFDVGTFGEFPPSAIITITVQALENGVRIRQLDIKSLEVPFTGEQIEDPIPNPTMADTRFDFTKTFLLKDGILAGSIEAFKTTAFDPFFNATTLHLFAQTKNESGQVIDLQDFPFTFGNNTVFSTPVSVLGITSKSVTMELFIWDSLNRPFSAKNIHTFIDETTEPPPPTDNFLITAIAENGFQIGGTVTKADLDSLNDPSIGVATVNATLTSEPTSLNITQTFASIMSFLISNQVTEPPNGEPPNGGTGQSTQFIIKCLSNGFTKVYVLSDLEFQNYQASPVPDTTIESFEDSQSETMTLTFVVNDIIELCRKEPEPPLPSNVCFTLLYRDLTEISYTLTNAEFEDLIANPVSTGICAPVVKNISDCDTPSSELGVVRSDIFNKVAECLAQPPEDDIKLGMITQSPSGFRIENNRLVGQISYVATDSFNPFWYGKDLVSITQIKDRFGVVIQIKENRLNFTQTERDELINIDSSASDQDVLIVEFFVIVSLQDPRRFSDAIQLTVTAQGQGDTTPNGGGIKFGSGGIVTKLTGGFFGLLALCLIGSKGK